MELYDVSRSISPHTAVWPGDQPVDWSWTSRIEDGASVNLGSICMSTHTGSHVDAPYHVADDGVRTDALPLSPFLGPTTLIEVTDAPEIRPAHIPESLSTSRVLFKTPASGIADDEWEDEIVDIAPEVIQVLNEAGVVLVGTDAPSVDSLDSEALPAHHALRSAGIVHLEGLRFDGLDAGRYVLLALPLKVSGGDAAPLRAVLVDGTISVQPG